MNWHLTWQDPVALALCVLGLVGAWWLRRRVLGADTSCGCGASCEPETASGMVAEEQLRLGRPR